MQGLDLIEFFIAALFPIMTGQITGKAIWGIIATINGKIDADNKGVLTDSVFLISILPLHFLNYFIINKLFNFFNINIIIYVRTFECYNYISFIGIISIFFASIMATILAKIVKLKYEKSGEDIRQKIKMLENEKGDCK